MKPSDFRELVLSRLRGIGRKFIVSTPGIVENPPVRTVEDVKREIASSLTLEDVKRAASVLNANAVKPAICDVCGKEVYVFGADGYAMRVEEVVCHECERKWTMKIWETSDPGPNEYERVHPIWGRVFMPTTWPDKSMKPGIGDFCVGSPRRFRDHEYVNDECRWCPRRKGESEC